MYMNVFDIYNNSKEIRLASWIPRPDRALAWLIQYAKFGYNHK